MIKILPLAEFAAQIEKPNVQLLDVRTEMEYNLGKINDALLINVQSPDFEDQVKESVDFNQPIYLYCRSGVRSQVAASILEGLGAGEVYDLEGGYLNWVLKNK